MGVKPITSPWHTLYIDLLGPYTPSSSSRHCYTLVIVDGFSKYVQLHPLREATAATVTKILEKEVFCRFSSPHTIVSDNATIFHSATMKYICNKWGITHSFCSPYHPQTNLAERVNRVVKPMLRIYTEDQSHNKWAEQLPLLQLAINTATHDSTGFTPYQIMFNKEPRLPLDNFVEAEDSDSPVENISHTSRRAAFQQMISQVKSRLEAAQALQKSNYDHHRRQETFKVGDQVVLKNNTLSNKAKNIVAGLCSLYSTPGTISKIISANTYEVTLADGTQRGPLHLDQLKRYFLRPPTSTNAPILESSSEDSDGSVVQGRVLRPRSKPINYRDARPKRKSHN